MRLILIRNGEPDEHALPSPPATRRGGPSRHLHAPVVSAPGYFAGTRRAAIGDRRCRRRHTQDLSTGSVEPFSQRRAVVALASWYPRDDLEFDFNLGAANGYGTGTFALADAAVQYSIAGNVQLLAEAFRDEPRGGRYQVGARYILVLDRFEAYASYGNRLDSSTDDWSAIIGVRLQTDAFLP